MPLVRSLLAFLCSEPKLVDRSTSTGLSTAPRPITIGYCVCLGCCSHRLRAASYRRAVTVGRSFLKYRSATAKPVCLLFDIVFATSHRHSFDRLPKLRYCYPLHSPRRYLHSVPQVAICPRPATSPHFQQNNLRMANCLNSYNWHDSYSC